MPTRAATAIPSFSGKAITSNAVSPAISATVVLTRSLSVGTTSAMKVRVEAKSSDQLAGICPPRKIPAAVLSCQVVHNASPAPKNTTAFAHRLQAADSVRWSLHRLHRLAGTPAPTSTVGAVCGYRNPPKHCRADGGYSQYTP